MKIQKLVITAISFHNFVTTSNSLSGDSSVLTRRTVDQEVVGSNITHGGNLTSVVRSLSGFSKFIKWIAAFDGRSFPQSWDLKYGSMSFADWLWSVIAPALGLQTIPDPLDRNRIHTGIAYAHLRHKQNTHGYRTCPPHRTTLLWQHWLWTQCRARCEKQQKSHVITWAKISQVPLSREVQ